MNISLLIIAIILFVFCLLLLIKIYIMKKTIREINDSLKYILKSDTNNLISITSEDRDIKNLAISLNKELKNLRTKQLQYENGNQNLKRMITDISHDLRTPLTAISGYSELLEEYSNEKQREYIKIINQKVKELSQLTEQLKDLSVGIELDKKLKKETCCINDILEETIASYYNLFKTKNITPNISICEKKVYREIDKNMIIRVFENLISNAIKYSDDNCNIILEESGKISFINKASKLDVTTVKKIFDRYYTIEKMKEYSGLGLSIAKQLVEINGGNISAKYIKNKLYIEILF